MENLQSIAAAVVVYNTFCGDSPSCQGLDKLANRGLTVLVYDNSTKDFGNAAYCRHRGWIYLGGSGNAGLSRAYNACIDYLQSHTEVSTLCLLDDDTNIDGDYFEALQKAMTDRYRIYVPLICSAGRILSPCILKPGYRIGFFADEQQALNYRGSEMSAINSCMAVKLSLFDQYRYDEAVFLDGIDHKFLSDMKQRGEEICVIPYRCNHGFSGDERPTKQAALTRFRLFEKDYRYILRGKKGTYLYLVGKRMLRLTLQYRSLDFILAMMQNKRNRKGL